MSQNNEIVNTTTAKGAKVLAKVAVDVKKVLEEVATYVETVEQLTEEIDTKTEQIAQLDKDLDTRVREANIDFGLRVRENEDAELTKLLKSRKLVSITAEELDSLRTEIAAANDKIKSTEASVTAAVTAKLNAQHEMELKTIEAENSVASAETNAKVATLTDKVAYLERALATAQETLAAEREARVEMARNTSQPVINVGNTK